MAQNILTKNNARSTLLAGITSSQTNLSVQSGHGARFSAPTGVEIAKLTLYDAAGNIEICHGITRSGDGWSTIVRAQEGTAARAWNAGDGISENATAGFFGALSQLDRNETVTAIKSFTALQTFAGDIEVAARQCLVSIAADIAVANLTTVLIAWTVENSDPYGLHAVNSSRIVCPAGYNRARPIAQVTWAPTAGAGRRHASILLNGAVGPGLGFSQQVGGVEAVCQIASSAWVPCAPGDYFEVQASQSSGGTINITTGTPTWFAVEFMKAI